MDTQFHMFLARASKEELQNVIVRLCVRSPENIKVVKRTIESTNSKSNEPAAKKQKIAATSEWILCAQCKEEYDANSNEPRSCERHPGELEMDDVAFPDDDEIAYGPPIKIPGDWRVKSCPESFTWSCCEGDADAEPCRKGKHLEVDRDTGSPGISSDEESEEEDEEDESEDDSVGKEEKQKGKTIIDISDDE